MSIYEENLLYNHLTELDTFMQVVIACKNPFYFNTMIKTMQVVFNKHPIGNHLTECFK